MKNDKLDRIEKAFVEMIDRLTEQGVIEWHRKGEDMEATVTLSLYSLLDVDPRKQTLRSLSIGLECLVPLSQDVLVDQFVQLEEGEPEPKTAVPAVAAVAAD